MKLSAPNTMLDNAPAFQQHVKAFLTALLERQNERMYPPLQIEPVFHQTADAYARHVPEKFKSPLFAETKEDSFRLHICQARLQTIGALAVEGWLARETARCVQKMQPEFFVYSYMRKIYPLWPVVGLAENHLHEILWFLEASVKEWLAARTLLQMDLGAALVFYGFDRLGPEVRKGDDYQQIIPHNWTRALFLARILQGFMFVRLLNRASISFAGDLETQWHKMHGFLMPEDVLLLTMMSDVPHEQPDSSYEELLVEMFKRIKSRLLVKAHAAPAGSQSVH